MKKLIKKINLIDFKKNSFLIQYVILSICEILFEAKILFQNEIKLIILKTIPLVIFDIILYFFLKKMLKKNIEIHNLYLIFIIFFGVFFILVFPPSQLPDDSADYKRSLEVSELHMTSVEKNKKVGRSFSKNINKVYQTTNYQEYLKNKDLKLNGKKEFLVFANKALYSFVCYTPQAIGVGIMRAFNAPIVFQILLGKIINFTLFVILTYLSIKYIPIKKELLFFICLLPITIQEVTSLSADCMTIATSIALISFIFWSRNVKKKFKWKHYVALSLLTICLSLSKIVYLPICFLILLIPKKRYGSMKKKITYSSILLIVTILLNILWLKTSSAYLVSFIATRHSNSSEQLKFILHNPIRYIIILYNTIDSSLYSYLEQMIGHSLGAFTVTTSYIFAILSLILLFYLIIKREKKEKNYLNNLEIIYLIMILLGTILLIFTSLYLQWTPVYAPLIEGVQGRYFIPLLLPLAFIIATSSTKKEKLQPIVLITSIMFNVVSIIAIVFQYM